MAFTLTQSLSPKPYTCTTLIHTTLANVGWLLQTNWILNLNSHCENRWLLECIITKISSNFIVFTHVKNKVLKIGSPFKKDKNHENWTFWLSLIWELGPKNPPPFSILGGIFSTLWGHFKELNAHEIPNTRSKFHPKSLMRGKPAN